MLLTRKLAYLFAAAIAFLAGCATTPVTEPEDTVPVDSVALELIANGRFREAADEYLRLATTSEPPATQEYQLAAAAAFVQAKDIDQAKSLLISTDTSGLPAPLPLRKKLVEARIALAENQPEHVLNILGTDPPEVLPEALAKDFHQLRAIAYSRTQDHVRAVHEYMMLDTVLTDPDAIRANHRAIWKSLANVNPTTLSAISAPPPHTFGGWVELAAITRQYSADPEVYARVIANWRLRYPGHPANQTLVPELMDASRIAVTPPSRITLLLPLQGPFSQAGTAVRDGFLAAWFSDTDVSNRPIISIKDTTNGDIKSLYDEAVANGSDFVAGPLDKASVTTLAKSPLLEVPTLALNHTEESSVDGEPLGIEEDALKTTLYQFALSPEQEAREVAERARLDGHEWAATLTPASKWGSRVANAFTDAWEDLGGVVVAHETYETDSQDIADSVKWLLNIDKSEQRWRTLKSHLNRDVKYEVRRRKDIDFIFMAAFPREARQIRPLLKFHHASDTPVYATSHVFSGRVDPIADQDVEEVQFGDMPWILAPGLSEGNLRERVEYIWPESSTSYARLFAFGVDAYRIIPHLSRLRAQPFTEFKGDTGSLSVDANNRIVRRLMWASFQGGQPRVSDVESPLPNSPLNEPLRYP